MVKKRIKRILLNSVFLAALVLSLAPVPVLADSPSPPAQGWTIVDTTVADFSTGTPGANTYVAQTADGEVLLAPTVGAEFSGSVLPVDWSSAAWGSGGTAAVSGGALIVDGAWAGTGSLYGPGRSLEFVASFSGDANQHVGFGETVGAGPWALFSTSSDGTLHARTTNWGYRRSVDTTISGDWLDVPHRYRIDWNTAGVVFTIDGAQVASHAVSITGSMRPLVSDYDVGDDSLCVDWLRMGPYAALGTFVSRVFDVGEAVDWLNLSRTVTRPANTTLSFQTRSGNTPIPDGSWSAWAAVGGSGNIASPSGQYIQYRVTLSTTDPQVSPVMEEVVITYAAVPQADLELGKSVNDAKPNVDDDITFTILLTNEGPDTATNVEVSDPLPAGLSYVSDDSGGTYHPATGVWDVGSLPSGGTVTLSITATVEGPGTFLNIAQVSAADQFDPDSTPGNDEPSEDDKDTAVVTTQEADLSLTKGVNDARPNVGDDVAFTVVLTNDGPDTATNVKVSDPLPAGLSYASDDSGGTYHPATGVWDVGNLPSGGTVTLTIIATVEDYGTFLNVAQVSAADQFDPDSTPGNDDPLEDDQDVAILHVELVADLAVIKVGFPDLVIVGNVLTYTILVNNNGPADATGVMLTDVLPADVTFGSVTPSQGSCSGTGVVICALGNVANGVTATVTIVVTPTATGTITNTASVVGNEFDPDTINNRATASVSVIRPAIRIAKTPDTQTVPSGSSVAFTIAVTNTGDVVLTNVTVSDRLAPDCETNLGSLDAGASSSYNCTVTSVTAGFTNSATVTGTPPVGAEVTDTDTARVHVGSAPAPASSTIYLPIIIMSDHTFHAHAPDLVVEHIIATDNSVQVVIKNQGDVSVLPTEAFWVDLYVNPNPVPTGVNQIWRSRCSEGIVWGVVAPALPLEPGGTVVLTVGDAYYWPKYSNFSGSFPAGTPIYVQVDSANANTTYGAVLENHEIVGTPYNNVSDPVYPINGTGEEPAEEDLPATGDHPPESSCHLPPRP